MKKHRNPKIRIDRKLSCYSASGLPSLKWEPRLHTRYLHPSRRVTKKRCAGTLWLTLIEPLLTTILKKISAIDASTRINSLLM